MNRELEIHVPVSTLNKIFELADKIASPQVRYDTDALVMANDVIEDNQRNAVEIASLISLYATLD